MGELVDLAAHRPSEQGWESCQCRCERCGHEWIGTFERPVEAIECPKGCGEWGFPMVWRMTAVEHGDIVWTCGVCERQSFALLMREGKTYTVCRHCGRRSEFAP